jgi:transposase
MHAAQRCEAARRRAGCANRAYPDLWGPQVTTARGYPTAAIKGTRFALQKNPWNLSDIEYVKLALVQRTNRSLYRAYLLKETLAKILDGAQVNVARDKLLEWIAWAARSRLPPFRRAARTIKKHLEGIVAYVATALSSARSEGLNGKIRTITRRSFGFHSASSLIALIKLCCGGLSLSPAHR